MGKPRVPPKQKKTQRPMPFRKAAARPPTKARVCMKEKQRSWIMNGLRAINAPMAGIPKNKSIV